MTTYYAVTSRVTTSGSASDQAQTIGNIRNAFLSCSFIRTTQVGSVDDLSTLSTTPATSTLRTFDIFAFNDIWQATHPLFIRVRYFTGPSSGQAGLECQFSMGTAHNGAGSFTGTSTLTEIGNTANWSYTSVPTNQSVYASSGDSSSIALSIYGDNALSAQLAVFERFYDAQGVPTGSGFHMIGTNNNSTAKIIYSQACYHGQVPPTGDSIAIPCLKPTGAIYNGNLVLGMVFPFIGKPMNPSRNLLLGNSSTFPTPYATTTYTMYGTASTYIPLASGLEQASTRIITNNRFLMRYI